MNKLLIVSLKNEYDLIGCSYLISSYLKENPHTEVSLLTYGDFHNVAKTISNITNIYTINRLETQNLYQNPLFSKGFAINKFLDDIRECSNTQWDKIINFSNDMVSSYLCTFFNTNETNGISISQTGTAQWNSDWAAYLNFYYPNQKRTPIHSHMVRHMMCNTTFVADTSRIKINNDYMAISSQNLLRIRQTLEVGESYIIAISLGKDSYGNRIDSQSLSAIVDALESSNHYKVVLLVGSDPEERAISDQLNSQFDNKLISISADYDALTSVLSNVDMLISTANIHLYYADALDIKIIQIKSTDDRIQTASFVMPDNYLILKEQNKTCENEVCYILNNEFNNELPVESMNHDSRVYQSINDNYSTYFTQVTGEVDIQEELHYHISRAYQFELMGGESNQDLLNHLKENTDREEINRFVDYNKNLLTNGVKTLLATLRSLKGIKQSNDNKRNFVHYLDELISYSNSDGLLNCPVSLFAGRIENISTTDPEQNLKQIETSLFQLKTNLQKLAVIFETLIQSSQTSVPRKEQETQL